jgi:hypothetical protein
LSKKKKFPFPWQVIIQTVKYGYQHRWLVRLRINYTSDWLWCWFCVDEAYYSQPKPPLRLAYWPYQHWIIKHCSLSAKHNPECCRIITTRNQPSFPTQSVTGNVFPRAS